MASDLPNIRLKVEFKPGTTLKSLESLVLDDMPSFVVLTGPNGSGKSQLLSLIACKLTDVHNSPLGPLGDVELTLEGDSLGADAVVYIPSHFPLGGERSVTIGQMVDVRRLLLNQLLPRNTHSDPNARARGARLAKRLGVATLQGLNVEEAEKNLPDDFSYLLDEGNITSGLAHIFFRYRLRSMRELEKGLSKDEARATLGPPPWQLMNEAFESANFPFRVVSPEGTDPLQPVDFSLHQVGSDVKLWSSDLSSGEQVILGVITWLYQSNNLGGFPKLLLLDEPDAHLHPSMARHLIDVLDNVLVRKHGVRVILTTHSPSTVALSPEASIFQMRRKEFGPGPARTPRIFKCTRDAAIGILTEGLPTLRVHHQNRRQVFVESPYDADNYQSIHDLVRAQLDPSISLEFIASGVAKSQDPGNCDRVGFFVDELNKSGVDTAYGIVDWDGHRASRSHLLVLGGGERYSLENFLLDPLVLATLLLRERICEAEELGLGPKATHADLRDLRAPELQQVANLVLERIKRTLPSPKPAQEERKNVRMVSGAIYELPHWFCEINGHVLETKIIAAFPGLSRFHRPNDLKQAAIDRAMRDVPALIPTALLETFRAIQEGSRH